MSVINPQMRGLNSVGIPFLIEFRRMEWLKLSFFSYLRISFQSFGEKTVEFARLFSSILDTNDGLFFNSSSILLL
jgi:hypothetical protein